MTVWQDIALHWRKQVGTAGKPTLYFSVLASTPVDVAPWPQSPNRAPILDALAAVFDLYQIDGQVSFDYDTQVYYEQLAASVSARCELGYI